MIRKCVNMRYSAYYREKRKRTLHERKIMLTFFLSFLTTLFLDTTPIWICVCLRGNGATDGSKGVSFSGLNCFFLSWSNFGLTLGLSLCFHKLAPTGCNKKEHHVVGAQSSAASFSPHSAVLNAPRLLCSAAQIAHPFTLVLPSSYCTNPDTLCCTGLTNGWGSRPAHLNSHHQCVVRWCDRDNRVRSSLWS